MDLDTLFSACLGVGLAAACGFRVFVPLLVASIAANTGHLTLVGRFQWIGSRPAMIAFAVATVLEILAYYVPWIDNLLDTIAGPAAVVAGILITASVVKDTDPLLRWTLAVIAGGGAAAATQGATTVARHVTSLATLGFGNHLLSTAEAVSSTLLSVLALLVPVVAAVTVVLGGLLLLVLLITHPRWRRSSA